MFPERFLSEEIAHPEEVKVLALDVSFDGYEWFDKYTNTLCSGLTKFHNLETLVAVDLDLTTDLWIEFAKNSKCLREIYFDSGRPGCKDYDNFCWWEGKEAALDALFHIPTLEKVYTGYRICMPYFPPGPSNIKYLYLHVECDEEDKEASYKVYAKNLHTHQNIKTLILEEGNPNAYNILDLKLDQMQLEELNLKSTDLDETENILKVLPPTIKKIKFGVWLECISEIKKMVSVLRSVTEVWHIEEIEITVNSRLPYCEYEYLEDLTRMKEELREEFKGLKKFVFLDFYKKVVLDVLGRCDLRLT
jgi:hypothetical protein